jgi:hypothetical protein
MLEKIKRIIELAVLINPTETKRTLTDNKPTIFVSFCGHVAWLTIDIHENGYGDIACNCGCGYTIASKITKTFRIAIDNRYKDEQSTVDECIQYLEALYEKWGKDGK